MVARQGRHVVEASPDATNGCRRKRGQTSIGLASALIGPLMFLSSAALAQAPLSDPLPSSCQEMLLGEHRYCFPTATLETYQRGSLRQNVVTLSLMLPDLRPPTTEDNRRFFADEASRGHETVFVGLVADGQSPISWDQAVRNRRASNAPIPAENPGPFGLSELVGGFPKANPYEQVFVARIHDHRFVIRCGLGGANGAPHSPGLVATCNSKAPFRDIALSIHFPAEYLDRWETLHSDVARILSSWTRR